MAVPQFEGKVGCHIVHDNITNVGVALTEVVKILVSNGLNDGWILNGTHGGRTCTPVYQGHFSDQLADAKVNDNFGRPLVGLNDNFNGALSYDEEILTGLSFDCQQVSVPESALLTNRRNLIQLGIIQPLK
jgi:hypothetical protein